MKVLVVIDMQNDFIDGTLGTPEAVKIVPNVVEKIKNWDGVVYATQDTHFKDYLETQEGKILPVEHCIQGSYGWKLEASVHAALKEGAMRNESTLYVTKSTFGSRDLAEILAQRNKTEKFEEIQLVGLCTDICVIANALVLKTFLPEVPLAVDAACCAGVAPNGHQGALDAMKACQVKIYNE